MTVVNGQKEMIGLKIVIIAAGAVGAYTASIYILKKLRGRRGAGSSWFWVSRDEHWVSDSNESKQRSYRELDITEVIRVATSQGLFGIDTVNPLAIFHDMDCQKEIFLALREAYPEHFLHTFAVKSNPLPFVLKTAIQTGMGLESASFGEVANCIRQVFAILLAL